VGRGIGMFTDKVDVTSGGKSLLCLHTLADEDLDERIARAEGREA
jgi:hypothetical protein